ncbi:hypothetical protein BRARA_B02116 [Brassica rapa]|uniref:Uncharacterized protein n=2 Tax=Brassica campestris TaxID=3711 RepID=A0A398ADS6_BRACM|nr:hypothetical protein IGI04_006309 [Brassica rapa subsp. trilocularis]RID75048.1 hypothetical protein BRARA_B02116 [Brassica rapa]
METSHELNFINPLASKHEAEDSILRLSSSSSSSSSFSSCSSVEAEPRPDDQSPPTQIMERSTNNATSTPPYRIPPHVFEITSSTAPAEWSTLSNESLFSIHMGDNTFTEEIDYFKSGELTFPQPPSPRTPTLPSPPQSKNQGGASGVVEEVKTPVHIDKKAAETDKAYHASKDQEQKAAASIRDVIMANKDKTNKLDHSVSRRSEDFSVKSFAFPVFGNADKGGLQGSTPQKKQKIFLEAEGDEGLKKEEAFSKPVAPKAEADRGCNRYPRWLSCFPCCPTSCV